MQASGVEDKTLIWVDSSNRDLGGNGSDYTVSLVEPLRNVVGVRVLEATIPATVMSIGAHNSQLCLQTVGYTDDLPIAPMHVLTAHTAGSDGGAWRSHDTTGKLTYYDEGHDAEHHLAVTLVDVYRVSDVDLIQMDTSDTSLAPNVICIVPGNVVALFGTVASYDPVAMATAVSCPRTPEMEYVTEVELVAGVYRLPHGKYDSLRDFVNELAHLYSPSRTGVMLTFLTSISDKPERSFQMHVDPSLVWSHVDTADSAYTHTYSTKPRHWCALWTGSSSLRILGFHTNPVDLTTQGGDFVVSEPHARYKGKCRARTLVDLTSERYVWLRCPELERHMCAGVGKVLQRGIGVFRLDAPGVLNQDKTEYVSVIPAQFHPISKISKLSFRFDMGSRENVPYDFREINHFMLLSVSTLRPDRSKVYASLPRTLNPDYEPNILKYTFREHDRKSSGVRNNMLTADETRQVITLHNAALGSVA